MTSAKTIARDGARVFNRLTSAARAGAADGRAGLRKFAPLRQSIRISRVKLGGPSGGKLAPAFGCRQKAAAFSLLEVMIALGIFFMAVFTILALVSNTLRNARALQRPMIDAGMVAAQYMNTNRFSEGTTSGDFEDDNLQDYSWTVDTYEAATNGLLKADIILERRGLNKPAETLEILVFDPNFRSTPFSGGTFGPRTGGPTR